MTTPSRANPVLLYQGLAGEPAKKPPPWIQTSTGSLASLSPAAGVVTLRLSVDSPGTLGSGISVTPGSPRCGVGPKASASRIPSHGPTGTGAAKRRSPTGAWAKGMPMKDVMSLRPSTGRRMPRMRPAGCR